MDNRAIALKLVLEYLGTTDIATVDDRMAIQKAIYLAQEAGVSLGYSYGWYVKGPYSPALTRDYYDLPDGANINATLRDTAIHVLNRIRTLIQRDIVGLARPQKLELLASIHYLIRRSGLSESVAKKRISELKPHLAPFSGVGIDLLKAEGLL